MAESSKASFPNSESRKLCWASRDNFFKCMNDNDNDEDKCKQTRTTFDENCSKTWVKYFLRRRDFLQYRDTVEKKGFVAQEDNTT